MRIPTFAAFLYVIALPAAAQRPTISAADYDRAVAFLAPSVNKLVAGTSTTGSWIAGDRFVYRSTSATGAQFFVVDAVKHTRTPAFDHERLAAALSAAAGATYRAGELPFQRIELSADGSALSFDVGTRRWRCDVGGTKCAAAGEARTGAGRRPGGNTVVSPDGKRAAFIRDYNLWVRDLADGRERQLTSDGVKDFGYATDNAGWVHSDRPILRWSPDSRMIATAQQDERHVGEMYLVPTVVGHPTLSAWKYPLVGDSVLAMLQHVVIDVDAGTVVRLQLPPQYHRGTISDDISPDDYSWSPDASQLALATTSRDHKQSVLRLADTRTGAVRTVLEETSPTHYESRTGWRVLWPTNEVIWYSQRDDWGNLYLYGLDGALKNRITTGEGPVERIVRVDDTTRTLWYEALGRERGQDPYFRHLYHVGLDGRNVVAVTPQNGDHDVQLSPSGRYLIDSYSTPDVAPVSVLRDAGGAEVMPLERGDLSRLTAAGWKPPMPIVVKAADGTTDLYGLLFRPTHFDSTRKYPIINNPYPGPQTGSVGTRSFLAARGDHQALAELGFVVITVDGRGTPGRSKSFHDYYYGKMGRDNTIPDMVAAMQELGRRYSWIDVSRAGIYGHSGGGFITADAMFRYPDFFTAGISESGNHDQREYEDDWGERYQGLLVRNADGTDSYDAEANQLVAKNLKGHLLLAHGTMDDNVPPDNTMLVVDALIKANKDFDLLMIPNALHGYGKASNYMMRRRWDYFVRYLLDAEPPKEYEIK
jgi:dipeptidyl-peptidase-4